ncbi:unnamed protein product [Boreogadus saida]
MIPPTVPRPPVQRDAPSDPLNKESGARRRKPPEPVYLRNVGLDSLMSMNRDMEEKGIVLRELSCRTAAELPAQELSDYHRSSAVVRQLLEYTRRSGRKASAAVQLPEYTAGAAGVPQKLRRRPDCRRGFGSPAVRQLRSGSTTFLLHVSSSGNSGRGNSAAVRQRKGLYSRS